MNSVRKLRLGVAGLGRAFTLMRPTLRLHPGITLVAAADPRPEARAAFASEFGGDTFEDVGALCGAAQVDALYIATPHQHHAEHAIAALRSGKHVLVEKPLAVSMEDAQAIARAAEEAGRHVVVGHSHSFDGPIARARAIIDSGELGAVRMITALNFTDFLCRPRRPEELDTSQGGGVIFSQAAHQVDIVRLLGGGRVRSVRAMTGAWDASRPTEGAYAALLAFEDGAFASLTYSGYGHYDSDELVGWTSELGRAKDPTAHGGMRRLLQASHGTAGEAAAKSARNYGGPGYREPPGDVPWHEHFGVVVAACEHGDVRPLPDGVGVWGDFDKRFEALPRPVVPRAEVIDALLAAVFDDVRPLQDARWGLATLEVCHALLRSAREGGDVLLEHQVAVR